MLDEKKETFLLVFCFLLTKGFKAQNITTLTCLMLLSIGINRQNKKKQEVFNDLEIE